MNAELLGVGLVVAAGAILVGTHIRNRLNHVEGVVDYDAPFDEGCKDCGDAGCKEEADAFNKGCKDCGGSEADACDWAEPSIPCERLRSGHR